jgi:hypothetical protein
LSEDKDSLETRIKQGNEVRGRVRDQLAKMEILNFDLVQSSIYLSLDCEFMRR